jgi:hypothetical protein
MRRHHRRGRASCASTRLRESVVSDTKLAQGLEAITAEVECSGGTHRLTWEPGSLIAHDHDPDSERVLTGLGADEPLCIDLVRARAFALKRPREFQSLADHVAMANERRNSLHHLREHFAVLSRERRPFFSKHERGVMYARTVLARLPLPIRRRVLLELIDAHRGSDMLEMCLRYASLPATRKITPGGERRLRPIVRVAHDGVGRVTAEGGRTVLFLRPMWLRDVWIRDVVRVDHWFVLDLDPSSGRAQMLRLELKDGAVNPIVADARLEYSGVWRIAELESRR